MVAILDLEAILKKILVGSLMFERQGKVLFKLPISQGLFNSTNHDFQNISHTAGIIVTPVYLPKLKSFCQW